MAALPCWHLLVSSHRSLLILQLSNCVELCAAQPPTIASELNVGAVNAGFVLAAQVTGKGPLGALGEHLSDPISECQSPGPCPPCSA